MQFMLCPLGTGTINIKFSQDEAASLLKDMNYITEEFSWDEYTMQLLRRELELGINEEDARRAAAPTDENSQSEEDWTSEDIPVDYNMSFDEPISERTRDSSWDISQPSDGIATPDLMTQLEEAVRNRPDFGN